MLCRARFVVSKLEIACRLKFALTYVANAIYKVAGGWVIGVVIEDRKFQHNCFAISFVISVPRKGGILMLES